VAALGTKIWTDAQVKAAVEGLAGKILSRLSEPRSDWAFVGIQRRGVPLARRLALRLRDLGAPALPVGSLDITLYRDDMSETSHHPVVHDTDIPFDISGKSILLVDDVLFTGRTIRCALDQLMDFGRPRRVCLAVLADRGHRELPISPDFVGETIATSARDTLEVRLEEVDGEDAVWMTTGKKSTARETA
jgi:pyrimidine operon attenuation protein / uracil phosphoribosyltransferase